MSELRTISRETLPAFLHPFISEQRYLKFLGQAFENTRTKVAVLSFPVDCEDPLAWFSKIKQSYDLHYYWQQPSNNITIAGLGSALELSSQGKNRFGSLQKRLDETIETIDHLNLSKDESYGYPFIGACSFFDEIDTDLWQGFKASSLVLPEIAVVKNADHTTLSLAAPLNNLHSNKQFHQQILAALPKLPNPSNSKSGQTNEQAVSTSRAVTGSQKKEWLQMVKKAAANIRSGELQKVVLARSLALTSANELNPAVPLHYLRKQFPNCYSFLYKTRQSGTFIGSSPELLLSVEDRKIETGALAGSIERGNNANEDKKLKQLLLNSAKDRVEHQFVTSRIKESLHPITHHLKIPATPTIKKLANVQHLHTPIEGRLKQQVSPLRAVGALHPTPAVGGVPHKRALKYILENEAFNRGLFASPIGWITSNRRATFAVALRSGLLQPKKAHLFAGCGIVAGSNAKKEWNESELKLRPLLSALNTDEYGS